jgi:hypothetical protein
MLVVGHHVLCYQNVEEPPWTFYSSLHTSFFNDNERLRLLHDILIFLPSNQYMIPAHDFVK